MKPIDIFPWNDNFNTGLSLVDKQHQRLVELLNLLASYLAYQSELPDVNEIITRLADYAVYHFETEEAIWHQYLSEDLLEKQHRHSHASFIEQVNGLREQAQTKPQMDLLEDILSFLTCWLAAHILESDRHLAAVVLAMQAGMSCAEAKQVADVKMSGTNRLLIDIILSIYQTLSTNTLRLMRELNGREQDQAFLRKLSNAVEQNPCAVIITDLEANIEFVNRTFENITGYSPREVIGKNPRLLQSGKTPRSTYENLWKTLRQGGAWRGELINKRKGGSEYIEWAQISPIQQADGSFSHYLAIKEDITERKQMLARLTESEAHLRAIIASEPECIKTLDAEGRLLEMSPAGLAMIQADSLEQVAGLCVFDLLAPEHRDSFIDLHQRVINGESVRLEFEIIGLKGRRLWMETHAVPMQDARGNTLHLAVTRNIAQRKESEKQLQIAAIVFESQEGMMVTDADTVILRVNSAFCRITGYSAEEVVGKKPGVLKSGRQTADFYAAMWRRIEANGEWEGEIWNRRKTGEEYPQYMMIKAVRDENQCVTHYVGTLTDITHRKAAAEKIERLAFYDPLTGLPNRQLLYDRLGPALAASKRSGLHGALLFIDLDNFKALNDTLGHDMGDLLLRHVAERLQACVREDDTVARLGGDEFVVMMRDLHAEQSHAVQQVERIGRKILKLINQPFKLNGHEYMSSPSVGITLFQGAAQSVEQLLKQADIAMYQAKTLGRNMLCFFDTQMMHNVSAKVSLQAELHQALAKEQFQLYYQVQVDAEQRVIGAETLIRWMHPQKGLISPVEFIPLAEEIGLINVIGYWVFEAACKQIQRWQQNPKYCELVLSVNVSPKQFYHPGFVSQIQSTIQRFGIDSRLLKLELTESVMIENINETIATMHALCASGIQFSLDDFGTGYSSLQYLKRLPLSQLKIDRSFVRDLAIDSGDQAIVRTIIAMAKSLNLNVIAEGVETQQQRQFLLDNQCFNFQGYLFGKPLPIADFETLLADTTSP